MRRPIQSAEEIWRAYDEDELRLTAKLSERMLDLAGLGPGMRVLDLATGRGEPAIRAARRVTPGGSVLGVDPSEPMLDMARARALREGVSSLELRCARAEALESVATGPFDAVLVRWGLMYLDAPVAALEAARRVMASRAVLVAALWVEPERASYFTLPRRVLERARPLPPMDPEAPGAFRYADLARTERDLAAAGLRITHVEDMEVDVMEAATDEALIAWTRAFGLERLLRDLPEATQRAWEEAFVREAEPLRRDGVVRLGGVTRLVVASRIA